MKISTDNSAIRNVIGDVEALKAIRAAGFDGVDYTFYDMLPERDILALSDLEREKLAYTLRDTADKIGLEFSQCHAEMKYRYGQIEANENDPTYRRIIRCFEYAHRLGIPKMVIHTLRAPVGIDRAEIDRASFEFMRSFIPYAEKYGVTIGVENLFARVPETRRPVGRHHTAEWMNEFMDRLDSPCFEVCFDIGHATFCGKDPADFIRGMDAKRLTMLHVQDTDLVDDRHWLPMLGMNDWDSITNALGSIGYDGNINLEVLHFYDKFPKDLLPDALRLAAICARKLADMTESTKASRLK